LLKKENSWEEVVNLSWNLNNEYVIYNVNVYDFNIYKEDVFVHFYKKIKHIGPMEDFELYKESLLQGNHKEINYIDGTKHLLMPSLIAAHTHIYSTFARGMSVPFNPHSFKELLEQLWWKLDYELDDETTYLSGLVSGLDFIRNGVTTVFDHHASGQAINGVLDSLSKALCEDVGIRGGFCFETSDRFNVDDCINENVRFMKENKKSKDRFGLFGFHASMSLSDETLQKVKDTIRSKPIHIHVAESIEDQEHCIKTYGKRVIERLDDFGLLNEGSILAHCIYINENEAGIIAKRKCYVALNPTSNMNNSVGLPNTKLLKQYGIKCFIGNDGMTTDIASEWRNLMFSMHYQTKSPIGFDLSDLHDMIINSYDYASEALHCKLGRIEEGYKSDLMMLAYDPPTPMNSDNALGHVVFGLSHSLKPKHVWCNGVNLVENYDLNSYRYKEVLPKLDNIKVITANLWDRVNERS